MGRTGFCWLSIGSGGGIFTARKGTFGFHKENRLLFDKLSNYQLSKEYTAPWSE